MGYIEGRERTQQTLLSMEDMIEKESMVRVIDRFVETRDLAGLGFTRTKAGKTGRPGYAAGAMAKLYIYGYENGIRSSRKLEKETQRNLEVMWLMEGLKPDHSSISEFRRLNVKAIKKLFRDFVKLCRDWELIEGRVVAQDGTKIRASNGSRNNFKNEQLEKRIKRIDKKIAEYLTSMDQADQTDGSPNDTSEKVSPAELLKLLESREKYEGYKKQAEATEAKEISIVDPDARLMGSRKKGFDVGYNAQIAVDSKHHIVLDCDVTNNPTDRGEMSKMAKSLRKRRLIRNKKQSAYLADKGYYSGKDLKKMKQLGIVAIVPRQDLSHPKSMPEAFHYNNFRFDPGYNTYTCPMGYTLPLHSRPKSVHRRYYNKAACEQCPHKSSCVSGKARYRTITRSEHAGIYESADKIYALNSELYNLRKQLVEHPFGTIKRNMNGSYFLLRTLPKVRGEMALFCLAYNIKRTYNILGFKEIMARLSLRLRFLVSFSHVFCIFSQ